MKENSKQKVLFDALAAQYAEQQFVEHTPPGEATRLMAPTGEILAKIQSRLCLDIAGNEFHPDYRDEDNPDVVLQYDWFRPELHDTPGAHLALLERTGRAHLVSQDGYKVSMEPYSPEVSTAIGLVRSAESSRMNVEEFLSSQADAIELPRGEIFALYAEQAGITPEALQERLDSGQLKTPLDTQKDRLRDQLLYVTACEILATEMGDGRIEGIEAEMLDDSVRDIAAEKQAKTAYNRTIEAMEKVLVQDPVTEPNLRQAYLDYAHEVMLRQAKEPSLINEIIEGARVHLEVGSCQTLIASALQQAGSPEKVGALMRSTQMHAPKQAEQIFTIALVQARTDQVEQLVQTTKDYMEPEAHLAMIASALQQAESPEKVGALMNSTQTHAPEQAQQIFTDVLKHVRDPQNAATLIRGVVKHTPDTFPQIIASALPSADHALTEGIRLLGREQQSMVIDQTLKVLGHGNMYAGALEDIQRQQESLETQASVEASMQAFKAPQKLLPGSIPFGRKTWDVNIEGDSVTLTLPWDNWGRAQRNDRELHGLGTKNRKELCQTLQQGFNAPRARGDLEHGVTIGHNKGAKNVSITFQTSPDRLESDLSAIQGTLDSVIQRAAKAQDRSRCCGCFR